MRWKAVDTNPPEHGKECLFTDGEVCWIGVWDMGQGECFISYCKAVQTMKDIETVSHWISVDEVMKLPRK